jgi:cell division protein FtsW (lipid II flippase)
VRSDASHPLLRASLRTRAAVALAIVYLMIGKPDLGESLLIIVAALAVGAVTSVPLGRTEIEHSA